uniref:Uncharacterized protein n=1 Tax=Anguilla anguilla TaxID=7936 RepID=A0A0E9PKD5_ANGAN
MFHEYLYTVLVIIKQCPHTPWFYTRGFLDYL